MATKPTGHGFEYFRHGTLSLYAALNTRTGDLIGKTTARHTSAEFVDFLGQIVASQPEGREIHIVADNLSAHKTKSVFEFLQANPTVRIAASIDAQLQKIRRRTYPFINLPEKTNTLTDSLAYSCHSLLRGLGSNVGFACTDPVATPQRVTQEVKRPLRHDSFAFSAG